MDMTGPSALRWMRRILPIPIGVAALAVGATAFACTVFQGSLQVVNGPGGAMAVAGERPLGSDCPEDPEEGVIDLTTIPPVCGHDRLEDGTYDVNFLAHPEMVTGHFHHECMSDSPHTALGTVPLHAGQASAPVAAPADAMPSDTSTVCVVSPGWGATGNEALVIIL
jgi:hypothetical protein